MGDDEFAYDVALVGAGGAGLTALHGLADRDVRVGLPAPLRVLVVDPVPDDDADSRHRTWCFWAEGPSGVAAAVHARWRHVRVSTPGTDQLLDLDPYRYQLVRSQDLTAMVDDEVARAPRLHVDRVVAEVDAITAGTDDAEVRWGGSRARARLVLDSRPVPPARPGGVWWWQHFRGWTLPAGSVAGGDRDHRDGGVARLMDFRTPQPAAGLSFGYLLPLPDGRALAEYTEFSPSLLDGQGNDAALRGYLDLLGVPAGVRPEHVETGRIPMTDGGFARRAGPRVLRTGTAGGATRGSTGYTFAAMLRQGEAVADLVCSGALSGAGPVSLPPPYPARHRWMDAVQLQALAAGLVDGPAFFARLFATQPTPRVLRFLDGLSNPVEELAVMSSSPTGAMARAAVADARGRLQRAPGRGRHAAPGVPVPASTRRHGTDDGGPHARRAAG